MRYLVISRTDNEVYWTSRAPGGGGGGGDVNVPDSFTMIGEDGTTVTLERFQLEHAATVASVGQSIAGVDRHAIVIAFMTVMVESVFRMYANSGIPESLSYPHDAVGSDNDSLGLFQQRPSIPWGTVAELMDAEYNARAFFGGASGPNSGNPPGLLDITGWEQLAYGVAAQRVQGSAFPDRYQNWQAAAESLYDAIIG